MISDLIMSVKEFRVLTQREPDQSLSNGFLRSNFNLKKNKFKLVGIMPVFVVNHYLWFLLSVC